MMDKKILLVFVILSLGSYWFFFSKEDNETKVDEVVILEEKVSNDDKTELNVKVKNKPDIPEKTTPPTTNVVNGVNEIVELVSVARKDIRDCEITINDILGDEDTPLNLDEMDETQLFSLLDEFDHAQIHVSSLGRLLEGLADANLSQEDDEIISEELSEIRPCKPFQKISFIHFLIKKIQTSEGNEALKERVIKTIFLYISKELQDVRSISSINMIANIYATLIEEKIITDIGAVKASEFIDELEDSYDQLIDQAEESLDEFGNSKGSNNLILKKELIISNNYRKKLQEIIKLHKNE